MRKLLCLLLVATALLGVVGARADVGPPVHVSILGEPRAAEPGVPFKGQLQITTDQPLAVFTPLPLELAAAGESEPGPSASMSSTGTLRGPTRRLPTA